MACTWDASPKRVGRRKNDTGAGAAAAPVELATPRRHSAREARGPYDFKAQPPRSPVKADRRGRGRGDGAHRRREPAPVGLVTRPEHLPCPKTAPPAPRRGLARSLDAAPSAEEAPETIKSIWAQDVDGATMGIDNMEGAAVGIDNKSQIEQSDIPVHRTFVHFSDHSQFDVYGVERASSWDDNIDIA